MTAADAGVLVANSAQHCAIDLVSEKWSGRDSFGLAKACSKLIAADSLLVAAERLGVESASSHKGVFGFVILMFFGSLRTDDHL